MSQTVKFNVQGMKCGGCVAAVQSTLAKLPGVTSAAVDLVSASALVEGDVDPQGVVKALAAAGYPAQLAD